MVSHKSHQEDELVLEVDQEDVSHTHRQLLLHYSVNGEAFLREINPEGPIGVAIFRYLEQTIWPDLAANPFLIFIVITIREALRSSEIKSLVYSCFRDSSELPLSTVKEEKFLRHKAHLHLADSHAAPPFAETLQFGKLDLGQVPHDHGPQPIAFVNWVAWLLSCPCSYRELAGLSYCHCTVILHGSSSDLQIVL